MPIGVSRTVRGVRGIEIVVGAPSRSKEQSSVVSDDKENIHKQGGLKVAKLAKTILLENKKG